MFLHDTETTGLLATDAAIVEMSDGTSETGIAGRGAAVALPCGNGTRTADETAACTKDSIISSGRTARRSTGTGVWGWEHNSKQGWHISDSPVMNASLPSSSGLYEERPNYKFKSLNHRRPPHESFATKVQEFASVSLGAACSTTANQSRRMMSLLFCQSQAALTKVSPALALQRENETSHHACRGQR